MKLNENEFLFYWYESTFALNNAKFLKGKRDVL